MVIKNSADNFDWNGNGSRERFDAGQRASASTRTSKARRRQIATTVIQPTGMIYLGGTGSQIGSQFSKLLREQCSDAFVEELLFDTEDASQAGAENGVSFPDESFVGIAASRVATVVTNPERHGMICEQLGLDDPASARFHESLTDEDMQHAGQVRSFGYLATIAEYVSIRNALKAMIAKLQGSMETLEAQLDSEKLLKFRSRICIHLVFSAAGGTGSSMALLVASLIRELTKESSCEITATIVLPSAFDGVLDSKPEQARRVRANCYATLLEIEAARLGVFSAAGVRLGVSPEISVPVASSVFNDVYVVGRKQANGKDIGSLQAVYSAVALHLAGIIGTEISDRIVADEQNEKSLKRLLPDPATRQPRHVGSIGAQAVALDVERMARHAGARQMLGLVQSSLGNESPTEVATKISAWLAKPMSSSSVTLQTQSLVSLLLKAVALPSDTLGRVLFRSIAGGKRVHFRNRQFAQKAKDFLHQFAQTQAAELEQKLNEIVASMKEEMETSLHREAQQVSDSIGYMAMVRFCRELRQTLEAMLAKLEPTLKAEGQRGKSLMDTVNEALARMSGWWSNWFRSKSKQVQIGQALQLAVSSNLTQRVQQATQRLLTLLLNKVTTLEQSAQKWVQSAEQVKVKAQEACHLSRAGQRLTTDMLAELDLSTPDLDDRFFAQAALPPMAFAAQLGEAFETNPSKAVRMVMTQPQRFEEAMVMAREHLTEAARQLSVTDVLADLLSDPATEIATLTRLGHMIRSLQPMWVAESGQLGVEFSDRILIGLPAADVPENRERVEQAIRSLSKSRSRANGQYSGEIQIVKTADRARVYGIRRTAGACWWYLPEIQTASRAYRAWYDQGGHSVHIFNPGLVAKMGSLLPNLSEPTQPTEPTAANAEDDATSE